MKPSRWNGVCSVLNPKLASDLYLVRGDILGIKTLASQLLCARRFDNELRPVVEPYEAEELDHEGPEKEAVDSSPQKWRILRGELLEAMFQHSVVGTSENGVYVGCTEEEFTTRVEAIEHAIETSREEQRFAPLETILGSNIMGSTVATEARCDEFEEAMDAWYTNLMNFNLVTDGHWAKEVWCTIEYRGPEGPLTAKGRCDLVHQATDGRCTVIEIKAATSIGPVYVNQTRLYSATFEPNATAFISNYGSMESISESGPPDLSTKEVNQVIEELMSDEQADERLNGDEGHGCLNCTIKACEHWMPK